MPLLCLERISMRYAGGEDDCVALRDVSLDVGAGELIAVRGEPGSGRTTLLRVAAGIAAPTAGVARFDGVPLARRPMLGAPDGIGYGTPRFEPILGRNVLDQVAAPLLAHGNSIANARRLAHRLLVRAGVTACPTMTTAELDRAETTRVAIARALATRPSLVLVDEPAHGLPPGPGCDGLLGLLHSLARREGIAVLLTTHETAGCACADRVLALDGGVLRGAGLPARVIPLRRRAAGAGAG